MAKILVVDPSASVRETMRIVLGSEHDLTVSPRLEEVPAGVTPDVVALGLPPPPRDERAIGRSLARIAPTVPLLLLHAPGDVAVHELVAPHHPAAFLGKPFDAYTVRTAVAELLHAGPARARAGDVVQAHRAYLEFPYLSQTAAAVARQVVGVNVPVLLYGEPGCGAPAVARALHELGSGPGAFVLIDGGAAGDGEIGRRFDAIEKEGGGTLFVARLDEMSWVAQHELLDALRRDDGATPVRFVGAAVRDVGALASAGGFLHDLAYRLTTVAIRLAPLRERREDLPVLAETLTRNLARRFGIDEVTYSPAARERLANYLWFGNMAELEAVLARTLVLRRSPSIDADDLVFFPEDSSWTMRDRVGGRPRPNVVEPPVSGPNLEVVLGELAHELRNPMVTIKTFAQHLDSVLADPDARARFTTLMGDAVDRMDGMLESLLDFARFRAPTPHPTDVRSLLDRVLGEQAEDLARRHVVVERNGTAIGAIVVDEAQILFAMRSLMRGLVDTLTPHTPLKVRGMEPGVIELEMRTEPSTAARLSAWVEPTGGDEGESPPLAWALAASLVQRNGGRLRVRHDDAATTIRLEWPPASS